MEAKVANVRDFVRDRLAGERVWRVGVYIKGDAARVTLHTPDKPARFTEDRDKGRPPVVRGLESDLGKVLGKEVIVDVVQAPTAVAKYIRISPRKCRLVVDAIRNKPVQDALAILQFVPNSAAKTLSKLIKSAVANAENNHRMDGETLEVMHAHVDEGPTLKRISPRAMGRAYRIMKRTSHITIGLAESEKAARLAPPSKGVARTVTKTSRRATKSEGAKPKRGEKAAPAATAETPKAAKTKAPRKRERGGEK